MRQIISKHREIISTIPQPFPSYLKAIDGLVVFPGDVEQNSETRLQFEIELVPRRRLADGFDESRLNLSLFGRRVDRGRRRIALAASASATAVYRLRRASFPDVAIFFIGVEPLSQRLAALPVERFVGVADGQRHPRSQVLRRQFDAFAQSRDATRFLFVLGL